MPAGRFVPERVLECGTLAGLWGAPHRWLPDTRARRVALIFLDDASRFYPHAVVGTAESAALFLRGLYE